MNGAHERPRGRLDRRDWLYLAAAVVGAAVLGWIVFQIGQQRAQVDALAIALATEQRQVEDAGLTPAAPAPSEILRDPEAVEGPPGERGDRGEQGPGPSDAQVSAAVEAYFRTNPPGPTPAEIAAAVVNYLRANPPAAGPQGERGPGPTAEQVADAVRDYLIANPPPSGPQGPQGERGEPGRAPTAEEVAAAVKAYIEAHPLPWCPADTTAEVHRLVTAQPGTVDAVVCVRNG